MDEQLFLMFIVIGGAAIIPLFARRMMVPSAALEIVYGIILFNTYIKTIPEWFTLLKDIGFLYLMFIVGMELDLKVLLRGWRFLWYIMISLISFLLTPLLFVYMGYPFYLGVAISVVSAGIIIPVLKEMELERTDFGVEIIGIALTGELVSIVVLTGIDIYHSFGLSIMAGVEALKLILLMLVATIFLKILYLIAWWNPARVEKVMESEDPVEEGIRAVISIAFAGGLLAYTSGVEPILGSFMAGLIFSYVFRSKGRFEDKINAIGFGFFTPFFFIGVGSELDIGFIGTDTLYFTMFLTSILFLSNIFSILPARFMGMRLVDAVGLSIILSAPLSMIVVAGELGTKMGLLTRRMNETLVLTALFSSILFPAIFRIFAKNMMRSTAAE